MIWFEAESFERKVSDLKKLGFNSFQFQSWEPKDWTDENVSLIKGILEKYDVEISTFWCGWEGPKVWDFYEGQITLGLVPSDYRQMRIKNLCDGADFADMVKTCSRYRGYQCGAEYAEGFRQCQVYLKGTTKRLLP